MKQPFKGVLKNRFTKIKLRHGSFPGHFQTSAEHLHIRTQKPQQKYLDWSLPFESLQVRFLRKSIINIKRCSSLLCLNNY